MQGSYDATVRMWCGVSSSDSDWVPICITLDGHGGGVSGLALTPDGNLYSGSMDGTICVWKAVDGSMAPVRTLEPAKGCGGVTAVVVGSAGTVVSGSVDGVIRVWSTLDGALRRSRASASTSATTDRASPGITDLAVGQDGKVFAAFDNGDVCVWSCGATGINVQFSAHDVSVSAVAVRSDGKLYTAAMDKTVRVW
jgi:cytochrome c